MRAVNPLYSQEPLTKGQFRRPHSALAGRLPSSGAAFVAPAATGPQPAPDDEDEMLGDAAATKARHLSLSRRLIELWGLLEVPAQRRQESIGSSMVLIVPSAAHVTKLRNLVAELEDYAQLRQRDSKLLLSTIRHQRQEEPYRAHVSDEIPLQERRPVSAAFVRPASASLQASRQRVWSRPGSARPSRPLSAAASSASGLRATTSSPQQPELSINGVGKEATTRAASDAAAVAPLSASTYVAAAAHELEVALPTSVGKGSGVDTSIDGSGSRKVTELRKRVSETHQNEQRPSSGPQDAQPVTRGDEEGEQRPPMGWRANGRVDASTMTVESFILQDSAAIRSLLSLEQARRHDVEEMYARPMSKLYLLFLTRMTDLEERVVRGLPAPRSRGSTNDSELLAAMSASGDAAGASAASEYGPSARQINKITTDETMARVFLTERAERVVEIEYAILINFFEESSRRTQLCEVLEPDGWRRTIGYILNQLSTVLCDGQWLITSAYLARYDIEREECIEYDRLMDKISRFLAVFRATDGAVREETRLRRVIETEELVTDAVLYAHIREAFAPLFHARFRLERVQLMADEQCARSDLESALQDMLEGHRALFAQTIATAKSNVAEYAAAVVAATSTSPLLHRDPATEVVPAAGAGAESSAEQRPPAENTPATSTGADQDHRQDPIPSNESTPPPPASDGVPREEPPQLEWAAAVPNKGEGSSVASVLPAACNEDENVLQPPKREERRPAGHEDDHCALEDPNAAESLDRLEQPPSDAAQNVPIGAAVPATDVAAFLAKEPSTPSPFTEDAPAAVVQPGISNEETKVAVRTSPLPTGDTVVDSVAPAADAAESLGPRVGDGGHPTDNHAEDTTAPSARGTESGEALNRPNSEDVGRSASDSDAGHAAARHSPRDNKSEWQSGTLIATAPEHASHVPVEQQQQGDNVAQEPSTVSRTERDVVTAGQGSAAPGSDAPNEVLAVTVPDRAAQASEHTDPDPPSPPQDDVAADATKRRHEQDP